MKKLHDTDRIPLIIRLPALLLGILAVYLAANIGSEYLCGYSLGLPMKGATGSPAVGFAGSLCLGLFLISVWFMQNEFFFDSDKHEIVMQHRGLWGKSDKRFALSGAEAIYIRHGSIRSSPFWDVGLLYADGKRESLSRVHDAVHADKSAASFAEATGLYIKNI